MQYIVAGVDNLISVGPFLSSNDLSPLEALAIQQGRFSLNGAGSLGAPPNSWGDGTDGYYSATIGGAYLPTTGRGRWSFSSTGIYIPVWEDLMILTQAAYDAWFASGSGGTTTEYQRHGVVTIVQGSN